MDYQNEIERRIKDCMSKASHSLDLGCLKLTVIPEIVYKMVHLRELNLGLKEEDVKSNQKMRDRNEIVRIKPSIKNLIHLKKLNLNGNRLSEIPDEIGQLINLEDIDISVNDRGGLKILPKTFSKLKKLKKLHLYSNAFTVIPKEIFILDNLEELWFSYNYITSIPKEIKNIRKLKVLSVDANELIRLPVEICELKELKSLFVNHNSIISIPKCILEMSLETFHFEENPLNEEKNNIAFENEHDINEKEGRISQSRAEKCDYWVLATIDGLHLTHDYRLYSAEIYGCAPYYEPDPENYQAFRHPYDKLCKLKIKDYQNIKKEAISPYSLNLMKEIANDNSSLSDLTCLCFKYEHEKTKFESFAKNIDLEDDLYNSVLEYGERILDTFRLPLFNPSEQNSIGRLGAIKQGLVGFWIGNNTDIPFFIARKQQKMQVVDKYPVTKFDLPLIYYDLASRTLVKYACNFSNSTNPIIKKIFRSLEKLRQSRELNNEARFKELATIAEDLAKKNETERLSGYNLRTRIAKIVTNGWHLYEDYSSSMLMPQNLIPEQYQKIQNRFDEIGWHSIPKATEKINDLWTNVRNHITHETKTFDDLNRNANSDLTDIERIVVMSIYSVFISTELGYLYEQAPYDIIINYDIDEYDEEFE